MFSFFRRITNSKLGRWISALFLIAILAGFAVTDITNFGSGKIGFGMGSSTLAKVGSNPVTDQEMDQAVQRRLQEVRQQNPTADFATIAGDFENMLTQLINQKAILGFADKFGFTLSKRLVDGEISQIPAAKGLNGKFSQDSYNRFLAQQKLTDAEVRELLSTDMLQRFLFVPVLNNARVSTNMAMPYASLLLEEREGQVAAIPIENFRNGLKPTNADLQGFYAANRARYIVPEQRVLRIARIGPDQVAGVTASDQEIAAAYNADKAAYAAKDLRSLTQVVVQDQAAANAIAAKAKAGTALAAAAGSAGATTLTDQSRETYATVAGPQAAAGVFGAKQGQVVGPFKSDFGWVIAKIDGVKAQPGKTLEQAKAEIATKLNTDKRKTAVENLVDTVQNAVDDGANFNEAVAKAKLTVVNTPLITAGGQSLTDAAYKSPPELAPALKTGFQIAQNDPPEIVSLPNNQGYAMVSPGQIVQAAPAPLASITDRVTKDWIDNESRQRAAAAARSIAAKVAGGTPLAQAMKDAGINLPVQPLKFRRIQIASSQQQVPPYLQMLFTLTQGKSRMLADPKGGGYFVVKVDKVTPGNAILQPDLIGHMQTELADALQQEYGQQFIAAMKADLGVKRNDDAIAALKKRLSSAGD